MKTLVKVLFIVLFMMESPLASASRVAEVEQFFHVRTTEFLQTRFPDKPFSVVVSIDTGRDEPTRKEFRLMKDSGAKLPFWYDESEDLPVWDRPDVPLGRLIKETKKVLIDIKVDASLSDVEVAELQKSLASQLKLDPDADSITVTKMAWSNQERYRNLAWVGGAFAIIMAGLFLAFWALTKIHVSQLIQGLSQPIKEIGNTTKKMASSALGMGQGPSTAAAQKNSDPEDNKSNLDDDLANGSTLMELRKSCLELIERNLDMFRYPDPQVMEFIESQGTRKPRAMGSILAELDHDLLKNLFQLGTGKWWFKAIAQPAALNGSSLSILANVERLRLRRQFAEHQVEEYGDEFRTAGLSLCRMSAEEVAQALEDVPIEKASPILAILPRDLQLGAAKILFPGQWAVFLDSSNTLDAPDKDLMKFVMEKAIKIRPMRKEDDIKAFFADLDLVDYLDSADPRDERDLYKALHAGSRVRQERTPFYELLESEKPFIPALGSEMSVHQWLLALQGCQPSDRDYFLKKFPERLRYQINQAFSELDPADISEMDIRHARRKLMSIYNEMNFKFEMEQMQAEMGQSEEPTTTEDHNDEGPDGEDQQAA